MCLTFNSESKQTCLLYSPWWTTTWSPHGLEWPKMLNWNGQVSHTQQLEWFWVHRWQYQAALLVEKLVYHHPERFRYLLFKRALRWRRLDSSLQKKIYEPQLAKHNLIKFPDMHKKISLHQTLACLVWPEPRILEEYRALALLSNFEQNLWRPKIGDADTIRR